MLAHFSIKYVTHSQHYHLGDIINVIQQVNHFSKLKNTIYRLFPRGSCPCCGVNTPKMIQDILSLLDTQIKFISWKPGKYDVVAPVWAPTHKSNRYDQLPYVKAQDLPKSGKHIVCQFDARSKGDKLPSEESIRQIVTKDMINVGDRLWDCDNRTGLSLLDKFKIIASAKKYIGVDSGLTHLALMTNVPMVVLHKESWDAPFFYPKGQDIQFISLD